MDLGIPVPTIDIAVSMREISALKAERTKADELYDRPTPDATDKSDLIKKSEQALYFAFIMAYAQGMHQLTDASKEYGYELDLGEIAKIWRAGCIIRAALLADITEAYKAEPELQNLLLSKSFVEKVQGTVDAAFGVLTKLSLKYLLYVKISNVLFKRLKWFD